MPKKKISSEFIDQVLDRLNEGKRVRRTLLSTGRLHIDRKLPFIVIYRPSEDQEDPGTSRLVKGEASYLISPSSDFKKTGVVDLLKRLAGMLSREYGSFLIIEVWSSGNGRNQEKIHLPPKPTFKIYIPQKSPPTKTVEAFERSLKQIKILKRRAAVEIENWDLSKVHPSGLLKSMSRIPNCFVLGLKIDSFYRDADTNEVFPIVLSRLHRSVSKAIKRAAFEFTKNRTSRKPANYQVLGRRAFVKAAWEIDKKLAQISQEFDFLLQVTPINSDSAWRQFHKCRFQKAPVFYYRPLPIDPIQLKRKLFHIPIEKVEDATLSFIFREKQIEIDRQLTMLLDRGKRPFYHGSFQLYGEIKNNLLETAKKILDTISSSSRFGNNKNVLNADQFARLARKEIDCYKKTCPEIKSRVDIRDDIMGVLVSKGDLLIARDAAISSSRLKAVLNHEIGTHILTYCNGQFQPFCQLYCGLSGYDELQEGLAVLSEFLSDSLSPGRLRLLAGRVMAAYMMQKGADFVEVYNELNGQYAFDQRIAFNITVRTFRGGGLVKDAVYLRGLIKLLEYLKNGGSIDILYCGKFSLEHVDIIKDLMSREIICPPRLMPRYLQKPEVKKKLTALKNGLDVFGLIDWR